MAVPLVAAIDPFGASSTSGLGETALGYVNNVFITVTPETLDAALVYIPANFNRYAFFVNVTSLESTDDIRSLLNSGAAKVFATYDQLKTLQPEIDDSRLVLLLNTDHQSKEKIIDAISDTSVGVYAHNVVDLDFITGWLQEYGSSNRPPVYVSFGKPPSLKDVLVISKLAAVPIVSAGQLTVDPEKDAGLLSVGDIFMAGVVSDRPDRLVSTLVVDERGVALGLVYSSHESVRESLRTGSGVYQSRKRGLWYKGATSGATQQLVRIDADCDQDCLRFVVKQKGTGRFPSAVL